MSINFVNDRNIKINILIKEKKKLYLVPYNMTYKNTNF